MMQSPDSKNTKPSTESLSRMLLLQEAPITSRPVVLLIRHAERPEIPANETGNELKLTASGQEASKILGRQLGENIRSINTSPIGRCRETAGLIKETSKSEAMISPSVVLGDPGAYVYDETLAWSYWLEHGSEFVLSELMASDKKPPGLHSVEHGTDALIEYFKPLLTGEDGYHVCVTHDVVLLPFIAHLLDIPINDVPWPHFLQAASLHYDEGKLVLSYQSFSKQITLP